MYKSILAANSSIFSDVFVANQGVLVAEQMVESCRIVKLFDGADDLRIVLITLHESKLCDCVASQTLSISIFTIQRSKDYFSAEGKFPLNLLVTYLRLGREYDIDIQVVKREHFKMLNILREHNLLQYIHY